MQADSAKAFASHDARTTEVAAGGRGRTHSASVTTSSRVIFLGSTCSIIPHLRKSDMSALDPNRS